MHSTNTHNCTQLPSMEFTPLKPNPKTKNLQLLNLFPTMNRKNFNHSLFAPFTPYCHPDNSKEHYHKKIKSDPSSLNEFAYFSTGNKLPVFKHPNPNPMSQVMPMSEKSVNSHMPRSNIKTPSPTLVRLSNTGKLNRMLRNNQPGMMVFVPPNGDIHSLLTSNRWENYVFYRGPNYYTHLIAEFYGNMEVQQRVDGIFYLSSFVNGKNVYVDHNVLNKSLRLGNKPSELPCVNIFEKFVFNQNEFELFLGLFCEEDVPERLCVREFAINFRHFLPRFQQLAIIIRSNILPKPKHDKFFDFVDLKVMFKIVSNSIDFNLNYVIVLNMINAFNVDYMPYGLLLTAVFETHYIHMSRMHLNRVDYCAIDSLVQPKLSLKNYQTSHPNRIVIPSLAPKSDAYAIIREEFNKLSLDMDILKESNNELHIRVENLEGIIHKNKGKTVEPMVVDKSDKNIEKKLVDELVSVGKDDEMEKVYASLPDLGEDLGVVGSDPVMK